MDRLARLGVHCPEILLPVDGTDLHRWAVVACDQYTSQPQYWEQVEKLVGDAFSSLKLMLSEAYLSAPDVEGRIAAIRRNMTEYLDQGVLESQGRAMIYTQRVFRGRTRHGLVLAVDLERYDYSPQSKSLVRATEATVPDRLPPRVAIRQGSALEMPHVLLLIDDPQKTVLEPLQRQTGKLPLLYDFELMQEGGRIQGWKVKGEAQESRLADALEGLLVGSDPMLFAVGDGNHSLATAKLCWENLKPTLSAEEQTTHPARFALCEVVNLHDPALVFEPIHRVLFGPGPEECLQSLVALLKKEGYAPGLVHPPQDAALTGMFGNDHALPVVYQGKRAVLTLSAQNAPLPLSALQPAIDAFLDENPGWAIDYVHGSGAVDELCQDPGRLGILLPVLDKYKLFPAVGQGGPLQRKSFSLGEAHEKRYYLECKRI